MSRKTYSNASVLNSACIKTHNVDVVDMYIAYGKKIGIIKSKRMSEYMSKQAPKSDLKYQVYFPTHPCYKKPDQLCTLREFDDSEFYCIFKEPELCQFRFLKKGIDKQ